VDLLILSNIMLWLLTIGMAVVTFALTRQIGVLYERVAPAGALSMNKVLQVGREAPSLTLQTLESKLVKIGGKADNGKSQLLFFVSPDCPVCKKLLPALKSAARAESDWMSVVLASDGDKQDHKGYVREYGLEAYPYIVSELLGKSYGVSKLPYAVVIDEEGKVASMGMINSREHLDSLFEAKERKVASIQEYMAQKKAANAEN
jgi:methylamine dehydrogenase accessory protein MauD